MRCINCKKALERFAEICPYCGEQQYDDEPVKEPVMNKPRVEKESKKPLFSEEECFLYGIHPNDEMYRKTMELNILSKNYK